MWHRQPDTTKTVSRRLYDCVAGCRVIAKCPFALQGYSRFPLADYRMSQPPSPTSRKFGERSGHIPEMYHKLHISPHTQLGVPMPEIGTWK